MQKFSALLVMIRYLRANVGTIVIYTAVDLFVLTQYFAIQTNLKLIIMDKYNILIN